MFATPTSFLRTLHRAPAGWLLSGMALAVLAACGGGGGGDTSTAATETPQSVTPTDPPLDTSQDAFYFAPGSALASTGALDKVAGGSSVFAAWNARDPKVLSPGMKVLFFGAAEGCQSGVQGPLDSVADARMSTAAALTGMAADTSSSTMRWTPSADTDSCTSSGRGRRGASMAWVNASDSAGGVGLLTSSGVQSDGQLSFFRPYTSSGQNGSGDNAYITGSFVNFRQVAGASDPLQPWNGAAAARLRSVQSVATLNAEQGGSTVIQVKQQMMATFFNYSCYKSLSGKPCQVQYLMNTAIARNGVSDWSTQSWFNRAEVWFDPVQGGIPIVSGPIGNAGSVTTEKGNGLVVWQSQGAASQHQPFTQTRFDVTISFDQLLNVMRITTARSLGSTPDAVTDAQIAAAWGAQWNDRTAWQLLSADVAQEVYNPVSDFRAEIGGGFHSLYVGPQ